MNEEPQWIKDLLKGAVLDPKFPQASYNPDGNFYEYVASGESYYAEHIDANLTIYYSQETKKPIGIGIRNFAVKRPTVGSLLVEGLQDFCEKLKSGEPIPITRMERVDTPDGPMHRRRKGFWLRDDHAEKEDSDSE